MSAAKPAAAEKHLRHKRAKLSELKDQLLNREIREPAYTPAARRLFREIQELEAKVAAEKTPEVTV